MDQVDSISVIIPVRNEEEKIEHCLEAVFNQTKKPYEVLVVDGHSTDKTVENAMKFPVKLFYEEYHTRAGACQVGIKNAEADFVAFTDADCIPENTWLACLITEFNNGIVGVGGRVENMGEQLWENSINLIMDTFLGSAHSVQGRSFNDKRSVKSISGCNSMYRKQAILEAGGFDTALSTAEDTELNKRLSKLGTLLYTPAAVIRHNHKRGLKDFAKRMYQYGYGRAKGRLWDLQAIPPLILFVLLLSLIFTRWIFLGMVGLYILMLIVMGVKISLKNGSMVYIISIPIIYVTEHWLYAMGFFMGLLDIKRAQIS